MHVQHGTASSKCKWMFTVGSCRFYCEHVEHEHVDHWRKNARKNCFPGTAEVMAIFLADSSENQLSEINLL
jgi:hypothetical protein